MPSARRLLRHHRKERRRLGHRAADKPLMPQSKFKLRLRKVLYLTWRRYYFIGDFLP